MSFKKPFLIAEISANHCGNFTLAQKLIRCAKINGADAVKLQTYTPDTMTINSNKKYFRITKGLWKGYNLWKLYEKAQTPLDWHSKLFSYARKIGIKIFSTPFDETAVDFLEKLHCPLYKVSSFEMTDIDLIKKIARTKKPMIISTGMATLKEIELTYKTAKKYGCKDITLLYCVSNYPSKISDFNLNNIGILKNKFKCRVGLSDHSKDNIVAISAVAAGAEMVEKHIGLNKNSKGLDMEFSISGKDILNFKKQILISKNLLGKKNFIRNSSEDKNKIFRRSIYVIENLKKGDKFSKKNIRVLRPALGLEPKYYDRIIGTRAKKNLSKDLPLKIN
jgi:pseudaminic acid synthase